MDPSLLNSNVPSNMEEFESDQAEVDEDDEDQSEDDFNENMNLDDGIDEDWIFDEATSNINSVSNSRRKMSKLERDVMICNYLYGQSTAKVRGDTSGILYVVLLLFVF